jgi:hypothetical protein
MIIGGIIVVALVISIIKCTRKLASNNNKGGQVELGKVTRVQKIKYAGLSEEKSVSSSHQESNFDEDTEAIDEYK